MDPQKANVLKSVSFVLAGAMLLRLTLATDYNDGQEHVFSPVRHASSALVVPAVVFWPACVYWQPTGWA